MQNIFKNFQENIFPIGLIFILALARLIPHPPNFTPIIAVAIMSSFFFKNIYLSILVLLISMLLGDIFIGFYYNMIFVYLSLIFIVLIFFQVNKKISFKSLFIFGFAGSFIFYLFSNFGVWMLGNLYSKDLKGLVECYVLAIPFFKNTFFSTLIFSYSAYLVHNFYKKA